MKVLTTIKNYVNTFTINKNNRGINNMAQVEGTAYWASLTRPNEKFEPMWRLDLAVDDATAKEFAKEGFKLSETNIDGNVVKNIIKFKRKVFKANGDKNQPPMLVDGAKKPLDKIVGNGSKVIVMYKSYDWNYKGKTGKGLDLQAVQVKELVEYTPKEDFEVLESAEGNVDDNIKEDF